MESRTSEPNSSSDASTGSGEKSRRWLIGLSGLSLLVVLVFGFQSLIFPEKEAYLSFLNEQLPNYELMDPAGEKLSVFPVVDAYEAKELLISFWATWCEPCLRELPLLERALPRLNREGVDVMLVNCDGGLPEKTRREVNAWLISERIRFATFYDFEELFLNHLHVHALPFAIRIRAQDKKILWMKVGELEWSDLKL